MKRYQISTKIFFYANAANENDAKVLFEKFMGRVIRSADNKHMESVIYDDYKKTVKELDF